MSKNPNNDSPTIVVKKIKKVAGGHHGGAWKIAYADFVTAMMAFFLLMWLLSALNKYQLQGIAEYFQTPLSKVLAQNQENSGSKASVTPGGRDDMVQKKKAEKNAGQSIKEHDSPKTFDRNKATGGEGSEASINVKKSTKKDKDSSKQGEASDPTQDMAKKVVVAQEVIEKIKKEDKERLEKLKKELEQRIANDPEMTKFKEQVKIDLMDEGLRIQIVDIDKSPMFATGSSNLEPNAEMVLSKLASELNSVPNKILISGHTDSNQFAGGQTGYSNWELSADRANATRRELLNSGLTEDKILRIAGLADTDPLNSKDPNAPVNRRISIILLNHESAEKLKAQN